ncbi:MAG: adenylyl-sulfate kinase [Halanaerobiales bacterium]|nr:adenylyl-sulfate kinase [Halanaerobiales bacterium]
MNVVIAGHVDHGKSTIIGRLLADTHSLPKGKLDQVRENCRRNSKPFEYAFLLDALKEEQLQGITIDSARCFFKTKKRDYILIDVPGHIEFLKNMVTGASRAEAALLVIDGKEGVQENTKRHCYMLSMLGIKQVAVLINKMDLVGYDKKNYHKIVQECKKFLEQISINPAAFLPVSGMNGDNIVRQSENMKWYQGPSVIEVLDGFAAVSFPKDLPFRMSVQGVYKFTMFDDNRRIVAGSVGSGTINVGDEVCFYPSGKRSVIQTIEGFSQKKQEMVSAGFATGFTLKEQIYITRGEIATRSDQPKPNVTSRIRANIFWLGKEPMEEGKLFYLKLGTTKVRVKIEKIIRIIDASTLNPINKGKIDKNDVAECILQLEKAIAFDLAHEIIETSRFVIIDQYNIAGGGIIQESLEDQHEQSLILKEESSEIKSNVIWHEGKVAYEDRCRLLNQTGLVIWFTGLSGSGKSTIAVEVEKELIKIKKLVYRLDGDNIRCGLNSDLGFSKDDRVENIRRIGEVAALFKDAGLITLVSFISPYRSMREFARKKVGEDNFIEVYVKADLATCINRDPKGLYKKAMSGELKNFTGISSPYEEPENPDLIIDTTKLSIQESVQEVLNML